MRRAAWSGGPGTPVTAGWRSKQARPGIVAVHSVVPWLSPNPCVTTCYTTEETARSVLRLTVPFLVPRASRLSGLDTSSLSGVIGVPWNSSVSDS